MKPSVLLDYQAAVERDGFVVRALLKLEGQAPQNGRAPLNISLVLDRSGSMHGDKSDVYIPTWQGKICCRSLHLT